MSRELKTESATCRCIQHHSHAVVDRWRFSNLDSRNVETGPEGQFRHQVIEVVAWEGSNRSSQQRFLPVQRKDELMPGRPKQDPSPGSPLADRSGLPIQESEDQNGVGAWLTSQVFLHI